MFATSSCSALSTSFSPPRLTSRSRSLYALHSVHLLVKLGCGIAQHHWPEDFFFSRQHELSQKKRNPNPIASGPPTLASRSHPIDRSSCHHGRRGSSQSSVAAVLDGVPGGTDRGCLVRIPLLPLKHAGTDRHRYRVPAQPKLLELRQLSRGMPQGTAKHGGMARHGMQSWTGV